MKRLKGWKLFFEINNMKMLGFKKSQTSRHLGIDYETVSKYWNMSVEEYSELLERRKHRKKKLDEYKDEILSWLKDYPDMSAAQIHDWLLERYKDINCTERSVRNYIRTLRIEYSIPKVKYKRQYEAVDELPMGYQAQVDFGQIWLKNEKGDKIKLYCFAMVLSHSRMKFSYWLDKPFTVHDFIDAHTKAFEYFGGRTVEIVYDQDRLIAVDENYGDIIFTEEFQKYVDMMKFKVYLCRSRDPESKGKIEAVVKYLKYNFAIHRIFTNIEEFNDASLKWLDRTGNAKVHGTTKKIPKEVFALEKEHLIPISKTFDKNQPNTSLTYTIRKDNTVSYKQNRYQVPKGTYSPGKKVELVIEKDTISIIDIDTKQCIVRHKICMQRGKLIKLSHPERDRTTKLDVMYENTLKALHSTKEANEFLQKIRSEKPRYIRDQLMLILNTVKGVDEDIIQKSIEYCIKRSLYSAVSFKDTILFMLDKHKEDDKDKEEKNTSIPEKYKDITTEIRDVKEYVEALGG